jgi:hypothetical protein
MIDNGELVALSDAEEAEIVGGFAIPWMKIYTLAAAEWDSVAAGLADGYRTART